MIRTLHHMAQPELALAQAHQVIAPEGTFILEFANKRNFKAMLRYFLRKQDWNPYSQEPIEFTSLNFDFHPKAVRRYLRNVGFAIEKQRTVSHFRVGLLKRNLPAKILAGLDGLLQWTGSFAQFSPSVFIRAKALGEGQKSAEGSFFKCPACGTALDGMGHDLKCSTCGEIWEYRDGIYGFRVKEAY